MFKILFTSRADKDKKLLKSAGLDKKAKELLDIIAQNPFQNPPPYEKLVGNLQGTYSRRISYQHRLHYYVDDANHEIRVLRMWSHYE